MEERSKSQKKKRNDKYITKVFKVNNPYTGEAIIRKKYFNPNFLREKSEGIRSPREEKPLILPFVKPAVSPYEQTATVPRKDRYAEVKSKYMVETTQLIGVASRQLNYYVVTILLLAIAYSTMC